MCKMILVQGHAECSTLTSKRGDKEMYSTQYAQGLLKRNVFSSALVCCKSSYLIRGQRTRRTYTVQKVWLTRRHNDPKTFQYHQFQYLSKQWNSISWQESLLSCCDCIFEPQTKCALWRSQRTDIFYRDSNDYSMSKCQQLLQPDQNWINAKWRELFHY